ncbi:MAG: hypothetical protein CFE25_09750 [Chitinophagaceae bacterium BSSC1]|nr:MAG: hypothetical protein CFE25_09750 [Chitinophagaceae bacterium BSSC1]
MNAKQISFLIIILIIIPATSFAQNLEGKNSFRMIEDVIITLDLPKEISSKQKPTILIIYALPNGNSTAWTKGKKMHPGDDWHFDIQHIAAQTAFIRESLPHQQIIVAYLENDQKSWPAWKTKHPNYLENITAIVDSLSTRFSNPAIHLNGHSGGGSFVFAYIKALTTIPENIQRISFLDSDYNYDSSYLPKLTTWLKNKSHQLRVFAYNDSIALFNGKPVVSATGGTWYRSKKMMLDLSQQFHFTNYSNDSLLIFKSNSKQIQFFLKTNPERKILHTKQVELNGFIHSELSGSKKDSKNYRYYGNRAYEAYIPD